MDSAVKSERLGVNQPRPSGSCSRALLSFPAVCLTEQMRRSIHLRFAVAHKEEAHAERHGQMRHGDWTDRRGSTDVDLTIRVTVTEMCESGCDNSIRRRTGQ